MSKNVGFVVANPSTGEVHSDSTGAVRVHEGEMSAARACYVCKGSTFGPLTYVDLCESLYKGVAYSFESTDAHARFLRRLKNDAFYAKFHSQSLVQAHVQWQRS